MAPPLADLTVLDFSKFLPGPFCTWMLADLGARVIRVENPREIKKQAEVFNWTALSAEERAKLKARDIFGRNKESLLVDIGHERAKDIIFPLARAADIVVEDYRPGVLDKIGFGYDVLKAVNPRLIYCSVTLCGQTGPLSRAPGHDPVALSIAGALSRMGEDPDKPSFAGVPVADMMTGLNAVIGVLTAVHARQVTGKGQFVDIAMSDVSMTMVASTLARAKDAHSLPPRGQRRVDTGIWRTKDGKFVCTTDMEPRYWERFCQAIGRPDFVAKRHDPSAREAIIADIQAIFLTATRDEWIARLRAADTQVAPVYEVAEALEEPHNLARGMVVDVDDGAGGKLRQIGTPIKLSETPAELRHAAHVPGADAEAVLKRLGLDQTEVAALFDSGVLARSAY
jgi:crotonobetainyl-CoA:carnitine CoA-transferase CaiB-like acyl-CoA transferase